MTVGSNNRENSKAKLDFMTNIKIIAGNKKNNANDANDIELDRRLFICSFIISYIKPNDRKSARQSIAR